MRLRGLGLALLLVSGCGSPPPAPPVQLATPPPAVQASPSPVDNLAQARLSARNGDWRTAAGFARVALGSELSPEEQRDARGILLETSLRIGDYRGARELLAGLPASEREALALGQVELARRALEEANYPDAILRARTVRESSPGAHEVLARAYMATDQVQLAVEELQHVPGSGPQIQLLRDELADHSKSRAKELARRQLELARAHLEREQWGQAGVAARKAATMYGRMGGHEKEQAEATVIEARDAASRGELKTAVTLMREAVKLDPTAESRKRLAEYEERDRKLVSRDELVDIAGFTFPETAQEGQARSSLYLLGSAPDDPVVGSRELVYTLEGTKFSASGGAMITVKTEGPGRDYWNLTFTGPSRAPVAARLYAEAGSDDPEAPALDISGCGRGALHSNGKFLVHEIVYGPGGQIERFAADFVVSADGHRPFFGKVRFHSRYR